jgi:hypothetical protein
MPTDERSDAADPTEARPAGEPLVDPGADAEPFLGYDGFSTDDALDWLDRADPFDYERTHRHREAILHECGERLRRFGDRPGAGER